jgi:hypothetical protein
LKNGLADTLLQLFGGLEPTPGLVVTGLDVDLPLEVSAVVVAGELVFQAQAPHSRWQAGFLPPVQRTRLKLRLGE